MNIDNKKYSIIINMLNEELFAGNGTVQINSPNMFGIIEDDIYQMIRFIESKKLFRSNIGILWASKYYDKELRLSAEIDNPDAMSVVEIKIITKKIIEDIINVMVDTIDENLPIEWVHMRQAYDSSIESVKSMLGKEYMIRTMMNESMHYLNKFPLLELLKCVAEKCGKDSLHNTDALLLIRESWKGYCKVENKKYHSN